MRECVVRMEMPQNCETCPLRVNNSPTNVPDWICGINQWPTFYCKKSQNHANEDRYLHDCPIGCQLPEGHGRLVDADALKDYLVAEAASYDLTQGQMGILSEVIDMIDEQPTIVPAERSEK